MASTEQLYTGRDILAAENHLRTVSEARALELIAEMPEEVVIRLAAHVKADGCGHAFIVRQARRAYAAR
jgi:hypothetical protein